MRLNVDIAIFPLVVCVATLLAPPRTAVAGDLCRWLDADGRANFGDVVPARYKDSAKCSGSATASPATAAVPLGSAAQKVKPAVAAKTPVPAPAADPVAKDVAQKDAGGNDCASRFQRYRASQECFSGYRQKNASLQSDAYDKCETVPDPTSECGAAPAY